MSRPIITGLLACNKNAFESDYLEPVAGYDGAPPVSQSRQPAVLAIVNNVSNKDESQNTAMLFSILLQGNGYYYLILSSRDLFSKTAKSCMQNWTPLTQLPVAKTSI